MIAIDFVSTVFQDFDVQFAPKKALLLIVVTAWQDNASN